jgi:outer membrane protein OmpA-like peptidoglycan-associated protein
MQKFSIALFISAALITSSGCASKKYVRNEVQTSADALSGRIEANEGEISEVRDGVDRVGQKVTGVEGQVANVEGRVSELNSGVSSLKGEMQTVDQKAARAQTTADRAVGDVVVLDQRFQNRNLFAIEGEEAVQFKFDSARLDQEFHQVLDKVADSLVQNPDAIVILEGRTDSSGNADYNVRLGERRVDAVRRYLAVEKEVPVYRIHQISLGAAKPVAENNTRDGREKNRVVTMTILVPKDDALARRDD